MELLVAVLLIGSLTAIAIPAYSRYKIQAQSAQAITDLQTLNTSIHLYQTEHGALPDSLSDVASGNIMDPWGRPYQYLKILYFVALVVAADRMSHESPLARPLAVAALVSAAVSFAIVYFAHSGSLFYAIHMAVGACAWFVITALVFRGRWAGMGKQFSGALALLTSVLMRSTAAAMVEAISEMRPMVWPASTVCSEAALGVARPADAAIVAEPSPTTRTVPSLLTVGPRGS